MDKNHQEQASHKAETVYQSKETTPDGNPFMTVKKARGYYYYAERGGVDSVAFILYDRATCRFGLIKEAKPPLDETYSQLITSTTAFGGSIDMTGGYATIVQTEVLEEAGYTIPLSVIHSTGETMVSTQMSQMLQAFLVDVTDIPKTSETEYELQGKGNHTQWMTMTEVIANSDWKSMFIVLKAQAEGLL